MEEAAAVALDFPTEKFRHRSLVCSVVLFAGLAGSRPSRSSRVCPSCRHERHEFQDQFARADHHHPTDSEVGVEAAVVVSPTSLD